MDAAHYLMELTKIVRLGTGDTTDSHGNEWKRATTGTIRHDSEELQAVVMVHDPDVVSFIVFRKPKDAEDAARIVTLQEM